MYENNVYVADNGYVSALNSINPRIQKFSSNGEFITKWGNFGYGDGELNNVKGIAIDNEGNIYVSQESFIQKFTSTGEFITKWGSGGFGDGEFYWAMGLATDDTGNVYVAEFGNSRIQKFSSTGDFLTKWASAGIEDGQFDYPLGIAIDNADNVYVADYGYGNSRVQKFTPSGKFLLKWSISGDYPLDLAIDVFGNVYAASGCIQKFTSSGESLKLDQADIGAFYASSIATDSVGNVYIFSSNERIIKFTSSGEFVTEWGGTGTGDGQFAFDVHGAAIALDAEDNVYVTDPNNFRIQKFTSSGEFISKWGSFGAGDGKFLEVKDIAIGNAGGIYVLDMLCPELIGMDDQFSLRRMQVFSSDGTFISKFLWSEGQGPGDLGLSYNFAINSQGKLNFSDPGCDRVKVFKPFTTGPTNKAIIVAGSGPYSTNTLWDATQMCANYAYRALSYQGYTRDTIYYLSSDTDVDLDNDGYPDVDGDATNANFEYALKTWASDADSLVIYMVGHGGEGTFRMGEYEMLEASLLDSWLDSAQQSITDFITILYDGCHSGSFVSYLLPPAGKTRILATSTSPNEPAIFEVDGSLSFGFQFFAQLFNGSTFYDSFVIAKNCVKTTYNDKQNPLLEANANGVGNEKADQEIANIIKIGNETKTAGDIPSIQDVSAPQTLLGGETSAFIQAKNVVDADGIQEVFAVIKAPNYSSGSPDNPVTDLPTINLIAVGNDCYSGTYNGFTTQGIYNVAVFARDRKGILSLPYQTSVTVPGNTDCLAVGAGLGINVHCVDYNGNPYGFMLDFYRHPDDPSGYYWKLVMGTLTTGTGTYCIPIGTDLSIPLDCVSYNGNQYGFTLKFYSNPYDPSGLYWKMDGSTLTVK